MTPGQTIKFLESEIAEMKELAERYHREREQEVAELKAQLAWWKDVATQAQMFLVGLTNSVTLAGRGWMETKRRLDEARPKSSSDAYSLAT